MHSLLQNPNKSINHFRIECCFDAWAIWPVRSTIDKQPRYFSMLQTATDTLKTNFHCFWLIVMVCVFTDPLIWLTFGAVTSVFNHSKWIIPSSHRCLSHYRVHFYLYAQLKLMNQEIWLVAIIECDECGVMAMKLMPFNCVSASMHWNFVCHQSTYTVHSSSTYRNHFSCEACVNVRTHVLLDRFSSISNKI